MLNITTFEPREYQKEILDRTLLNVNNKKNTVIELDCGLGKRFLQFSLLFEKFMNKSIILILQSSSSLYETYNYLLKYSNSEELALIDSRSSSAQREWKLETKRIVLCLPQTLSNTIKKFPNALLKFDMVIINEIDQIIRRTSVGNYLKQPYNNLFHNFQMKTIIGMSGTLRDEHYVVDRLQKKMKNELISLCETIGNVEFLSMDSIMETDVKQFIEISEIIPTAIIDDKLLFVSMELDLHIDDVKREILNQVKKSDINLFYDLKRNSGLFFNPLPIPEELQQKLFLGYLTRKYLWAMSGKKSRFHLMKYGLSNEFLKNNLPIIPAKFFAIKQLVFSAKKSIILCSYLDTVGILSRIIAHNGIKTIEITGKIASLKRASQLDEFRISEEQTVAIISNVGERDLDLPEAEILIVFDLVRTTKTVYQKLKRSRGGKCYVLYYHDTNEEKKVKSVLNKIDERYNWSIKLMPKMQLMK
ncbi:MAG: ATP-dependent RNA helicase SrmB [Candidatus Heimdallarchaeota archaeon LC_2]|nr:MAG: ATP-dependent RNA helicase SrmB [Candidatus Heimdallarchaeota archaeon LC_2]